MFDVPVLAAIAETHDADPAQVALAWLRRKESVVTIPKATDRTHQASNLAATTVSLSEAECDRIDDLDCGEELFPE